VTRIQPLARDEVPELEPVFSALERAIGFVPNSLLTMAAWPELVQAFSGLAGLVLAPRCVPTPLKQLVALVASRAAGCRYCQAHTSHAAHRGGTPAEKIAAAFEFETSPLFDAAERAALRLARDASLAPSAADASHFEALREHFDDAAILELVATIALFGWLNRWNDALATTLEADPLAFASARLAPKGWSAGPHAP